VTIVLGVLVRWPQYTDIRAVTLPIFIFDLPIYGLEYPWSLQPYSVTAVFFTSPNLNVLEFLSLFCDYNNTILHYIASHALYCMMLLSTLWLAMIWRRNLTFWDI